MKKFLASLLTAFFFTNFTNAADVYVLDPNHTSVTWFAGHFGFSNTSGKFSDIQGTINLDEKDPQQSSVEVTIKTASLATGLAKFDEHLKSRDFFDVATFPTAKFTSTSVAPIGKNAAKVKGKLTLLNVSKLVTLDVKLNKKGLNLINQKQTIGFSASTIIKRSDFGMKFGLPGISDNVKLIIEAEGNFDSAKSSPEASSVMPAWKIIPEQSKIEFEAKQDSSSIKGSFEKFSGNIIFHPYRTNESKVEIEVDMSSINTSFAEALENLQSAAWLAVAAFPKANFQASQFIPINKNGFRALGKLTIKGKTVPINLDFTLDKFSEKFAHATGKTTIKRSDFGIGNRDVKKANGVKDDVIISFTIAADRM